MADSTIKKVQVTGAAAESFAGGGNRTRRKSRGLVVPRQVQKGGDNSGALVQLTASSTTAPSVTTPSPTPSMKGPVVGVAETKPATLLGGSPILKGGAGVATKAVKVVLAPKKKTQKVVLSPAKKIIKLPATPTTAATAATVVAQGKKVRGKTHKAARRIRVSVEGLTKRMNRAKTIKKDSQKLALEQLKEELVAAGLIKKESKAPESILRQMYTDFQLLKQRAL